MNSRVYIDVMKAKNLKNDTLKLVSVLMRLISKVNPTITEKDIDDMLNGRNTYMDVYDDSVVIKLLRNKDGIYKDYLSSFGVDISNIIFTIDDEDIMLQKDAINVINVPLGIGYDGSKLKFSSSDTKEIYKNTDVTIISLTNPSFSQKHSIKYLTYTNSSNDNIKEFDVDGKVIPITGKELIDEIISARDLIKKNVYEMNKGKVKTYRSQKS